MNRRDQIIAQKTFSARKLRHELKTPGTDYISSFPSPFKSSGDFSQTSNSSTSIGVGGSFPTISSSPQKRPQTSAAANVFLSTKKDFNFTNQTSTFSDQTSNSETSGGASEYRLDASELARRAVTAKTGIRKVQQQIMASMKAQSTSNLIAASDNHFMPKVRKLRPDGASLGDVYYFKQIDAWGKIVKAQQKDGEVKAQQEEQKRIEANNRYAELLKRQLEEIHRRKVTEGKSDDSFAHLEQERVDKVYAEQERRSREADAQYRLYIQRTDEDVKLKTQRRERELREELEAGVIMAQRSAQLAEEEQQRQKETLMREKERLARLFQENEVLLERKAMFKKRDADEILRLREEMVEIQRKEDERKKAEFELTLKKTAGDNPVHKLIEDIKEKKKKAEDEFARSYLEIDSSLTKQLAASETVASQRKNVGGSDLIRSWKTQQSERDRKKKEEEEHVRKIGDVMRRQIERMEVEDQEKRRQQKEKWIAYKKKLDDQLTITRNRSLNSLSETMSANEMKYNSDLLRKTGGFEEQGGPLSSIASNHQ